jgi:hypothetical protein
VLTQLSVPEVVQVQVADSTGFRVTLMPEHVVPMSAAAPPVGPHWTVTVVGTNGLQVSVVAGVQPALPQAPQLPAVNDW